MTKLSIITADSSSIEVKGKQYPCIILRGRGEDGKVLKRRIPFFPYFYLLEEDYRNLNNKGFFDKMHVQNVEGCAARSIMKRLLTKITVQDAGRIGDNIHMVNKCSKQLTHGLKFDNGDTRTVYTYEADLGKSELLPLRWMIDNDIRCGVEIEGNNYKPIDFSMPLRKWFLDFEAYTLREYTGGMNPEDYLIMVSVWDSYEEKMYTFYVVNPNWTYNQYLKVQEIVAKKRVDMEKRAIPWEPVEYKTEAAFLDGLMALKLKLDPDLLIAWNLNRYDIEKWKRRADVNQKVCLYNFRDISPLKGLLWHNRPHRVKGMVLFDLMVAFKQFTDAEMDSYALAYVTESEGLGVDKVAFKGSSGMTWDQAPEIMFDRNINDVLIMKALDDKYGLIETYDEARKEFGCLFHESFVRNRVIDSALLRMTHGKVVLGTPRYGGETSDKLLGALVKEPEPQDVYWVAGLDLSRDYPNIIKGFNISPETYRDKEPKQDHYTINYEWEDKENPALGNRKFKAYFIKRPTGLLPQLILSFDAKRDYYQAEMKKAIVNKEPAHVIKKWERRQYNIKKTTNAIYGVMDYAGFRLMRKECTQAVAVLGRITIEEMIRYLETLGYVMLYGDTDSTFVKLHSSNKEDCLKEGQELQAKINEHLTKFFFDTYGVTAHAELGLKAIYKKVKFLAKKNYAGKVVWDEKKLWIDNDSPDSLEIKGIASVRSDSSVLEKVTLKNVIKLDLEDTDPKLIQEFIDTVLTDFKARKYGPLEIAYPAQIKKRIWKDVVSKEWKTAYLTTVPAHVKAAIYSNKFLNTDYVEGDKPRRLAVKFNVKSKVIEHQETLFKTTAEYYPLQWEFRGKTRKCTDISIVEDFTIPKPFIEAIDWDRIEKRLVGKLNKVLHLKEEVEREDESL